MSNHANDVFMDVMEVLTHYIYKRPAYNIRQVTSRKLARVNIECDIVLSQTPFLDVDADGFWHIEINYDRKVSKVSTLNWSYSNQDGEYRLYGIAGNGRRMKSPAIYDDGKPLQEFYPKLKDILNGRIPSGFAFFAVSLASTLSREVTGIGISVEEFVTKWQEAIATKNVKALDSLTYQF